MDNAGQGAEAPTDQPQGEQTDVASEELGEAVSKMFAGKFKSTEALEEGYTKTEAQLRKLQQELADLKTGKKKAPEQTIEREDAPQDNLFMTVAESFSRGEEPSADIVEALGKLGVSQGDMPLIKEFVEYRQNQLTEKLKGIVETDPSELIKFANENYDEKRLAAYQSMIDAGEYDAVLPKIEADYKGKQTEKSNLSEGSTSQNSQVATSGAFKSKEEIGAAMKDIRYGYDQDYMKQIRQRFEATPPALYEEWQKSLHRR